MDVLRRQAGATAPRISVNFGTLSRVVEREPLAAVAQMLTVLPRAENKLAGIEENFNRYPAFPIHELTVEPDGVETLLQRFALLLGRNGSGRSDGGDGLQ